MTKRPFRFLQPVVWEPNPAGVTEESKPLIGKVMLWLGEIQDQDANEGVPSGHCVVVHDGEVFPMMHTCEFRAATPEEW